MEMKIRIVMDNQAHADCPVVELEKNFQEILYCFSAGQMFAPLLSCNGNCVGQFIVED